MPILRTGICPLLTEDVLRRCRDAGITSVLDFLSTDSEALCTKCQLSYKDVVGINHVLRAQYAAFPQNALHLYEELLSSLAIFGTGCPRLDEILDGGIYTGEITEIVGPPAAGKTQLCHSMVTSVCLETRHSALYIDTGGSFSCRRIADMLKSRNVSQMDADNILQRIHMVNAYDVFELMKLLEDLKIQLCSQSLTPYRNLKLVILDSVAAVISPRLGIQNSDGRGLMVHLAYLLKNLCSDHALAVVICNNTVRGDDGMFKPALGQYWKFVPSVTLQMERDSRDGDLHSNVRKVTTKKSCRQFVPVSTKIRISLYGIEAADDE
ncbi:DNA repair protein RAD51 homolog 4-like isoform X1 [Centruroides sculpturatus]|uniref:DNA repair protein RAD51 homolog 4-like isoform X1 n=1 Tax=Centruroides sculpturatus TaxID=218467 RepID=UPI000C6CA400|nr:DNA repair protein RAD51 homolog 4-like isoform X1 [Centruroides sculpturatus]XP_023215142.1 DNA repair protein RAD51 homolog 4-like isoform X1 [Centruroides sculpturatus]XP_023215144.1 DNA repair protein RAD51 homolog 4-like isoform X1 [Centruroides sculpturatus]